MNELISERLQKYELKTTVDEQNAIKEIMQEIILYALSKTNFFSHSYFLGGTALRVVHGLNRFSEDLDFSTKSPTKEFSFDPFIDDVLSTLKDYGFDMVLKKSKDDSFVKARELKEDSEKWKISFPHSQGLKKVNIKLEIDSNPPSGSMVSLAYLDFPVLHQLSVGSLETSFAGKIHALLSRPYVKGRDWYDLLWYIKKGVSVNYEFLKNALNQMGPFQGKDLQAVDGDFLIRHLTQKIESLDWKKLETRLNKELIKCKLPSYPSYL